MTLAAEDPADKLASSLALRPEVRLIDFTGGNAFGDWLEKNAPQATVFTEKAGVNTVVIDSTSTFAAMCQNLAFSFALYTGQMCTAPQNVYLPADGIETDEGHKSSAEVGGRASARRSTSCSATTPARSSCSAASSTTACSSRLDAAGSQGEVLVASRTVTHPAYADATVRTPDHHRADRGRLRRLRGRVLRPGRLPDRDRRAPRSRSTLFRDDRASSTAR